MDDANVEDVTKRLEEIVSFMEQIEHEILSLFFSLHISPSSSPRSKVIVADSLWRPTNPRWRWYLLSYTGFTESRCLSSRGKARITAGRSRFDRGRLRDYGWHEIPLATCVRGRWNFCICLETRLEPFRFSSID